jgi:hypothetical protein
MFADHQPLIAASAKRSPAHLGDVLYFVLGSIREPIKRMPLIMASLRELGGNSPFLWGYKREAYTYIAANLEGIYADTMEMLAIADPERREREALAYFAMLPGFGIAKGGFVVQLVFGQAGCIDTNNVNRFNVLAEDRKREPSWLRADEFKRRPRQRANYLDAYLSAVANMGGTADLWDTWCEFVAERDFADAEDISALHLLAIRA